MTKLFYIQLYEIANEFYLVKMNQITLKKRTI